MRGTVDRPGSRTHDAVLTTAAQHDYGTVTIPHGNTASDPAVVAHVIEFYRTNVDSRAELSDDRFLERLRSGHL